MTPEPEMRAGSADEVLAIADALERAAVSRYARLADVMRRIGRRDLAEIFQSLTDEEQLHVQGVQQLLRGRPAASPPADLRRWVLPETFGAEETGPAALLTPYKALSIAVRAEERAFSFWTYVASTAEDQSVRAQAEDMARQELVHAARLRHARRRAYHEELPRRVRPDDSSSIDAPTVRAELTRLEAEARASLQAIAERLELFPDAASASLLRDIVGELTGPEPTAARTAHADPDDRLAWAVTVGAAGLLFEAVGALERLAERGLEMLGASSDAAATAEIEAWIDRNSARVARVSARLNALEPRLAEIAAGTGAEQPSSGRGVR